MDIREARLDDLPALLALYTELHQNELPVIDEALTALWQRILDDPNHHILLGLLDGAPVCSCVLLIVPNLTQKQRPYALIENVITRAQHRGQGHATALLQFARKLAEAEDCYKIMLMTGAKEEGTLRFYERVGFNRADKTAFVQWL